MKILPSLRQKIKRMTGKTPKKWRKLFAFGIETLSLRPFQSLNANARLC